MSAPRSGLVAVLFTDLVGPTGFRGRLGDAAGPLARQQGRLLTDVYGG